ncbi:MAG: HAMP domain-containing protein [Clostridia bacterium]|nr:HAMP domain-containing protein [Clostridia bacterium]
MFKSVRLKIVLMFVLMVVSVIVMVGTFFRMSISSYYTNEFSQKITSQAAAELSDRITDLAISGAPHDEIASVIETYSSRLGVDMFRTVYILDGISAQTIYHTNTASIATLEKTPNIIAALSGSEGKTLTDEQSYMDWAKPVMTGDEVAYILYVKDTKEELDEIVGSMLKIILQAMLFGLGISLLLGYFMSKTITSPIISLTRSAERLAAGDFSQKINSEADDEIGQLSRTFNEMATRIKDNVTTIEEEKNKMTAILMHMTDGVMAFDSAGKLIHINRAAIRIIGKHNAENVTFGEFFEKIGADISLSEISFRKNETITRDIDIGGKHIQLFFATSGSKKDSMSAIIVMLRDVTEQMKLEMSRREFVSNVSHELRTPITTIKTYAETLLESEDIPPEMEKNFLGVMHSEADRMARLVSDLLDLSKLDYNPNDMQKEHFDLKALLEDVVKKLGLEATARNQDLSLSFANTMKPIFGNRDRIEQVITNIISNAIKYTPDGGEIKVSAGNIYSSFYIKVKDSGVGIPKEDLQHIFERFYRVDKARSRQSGGTGLGLAIAKEIVEAHGGQIKIESEFGEGTLVTVKFPVKPTGAEHKV